MHCLCEIVHLLNRVDSMAQRHHCCCQSTKTTHTHTQPFYISLDFVRDNPGEPVPEETFTHSLRQVSISYVGEVSLMPFNRYMVLADQHQLAYQMSVLTHCKVSKGNAKCRNWGGYGSPKVIGNLTIL